MKTPEKALSHAKYEKLKAQGKLSGFAKETKKEETPEVVKETVEETSQSELPFDVELGEVDVMIQNDTKDAEAAFLDGVPHEQFTDGED